MILLAGAAVAVLVTIATTSADVDLWGHVLFGLDMLRSGLHRTDPYSFTSDRNWLNHEWLSEIVFAIAWRAAGAPGLIVLKLGCILTAFVMLADGWRRKGITGHQLVLMSGLLLLGILPRVSHVRPQLFSVVLFAALIRIFLAADRGSGRSLAWAVPVLVLWANFHGGWLVGLMTVGLWGLGEAWARRTEPKGAFVALFFVGASAAATFLNPYGLELWSFMLDTVRFGREGIEEWGPIWTSPGVIAWVSFAALTIMALRRVTWPRNPATVLIPVFWGIASFRVGRLDAFFALSVIGLLAEPLASLLGRGSRSSPALSRQDQLASVILAGALLVAVPPARRAFSCIGINPARFPEPEAIAYMRQHDLTGRIVTFFDWGEYAIWNMPPALKVSMDGRRETVYSDATVRNHLELYLGTPAGLAYLEELNADFVWLPRGIAVLETLSRQGWVSVFEGPRSTLLVNAGRQSQSPLQPMVVIDEPLLRCFPGP